MLVGRVAHAVDRLSLFGERDHLAEGVATPRLLEGVTVKLADILRGPAASARRVPRAASDAVARVDRVGPLRAQIRAPGGVATSGGGGEALTVRVGTGQAARDWRRCPGRRS